MEVHSIPSLLQRVCIPPCKNIKETKPDPATHKGCFQGPSATKLDTARFGFNVFWTRPMWMQCWAGWHRSGTDSSGGCFNSTFQLWMFIKWQEAPSRYHKVRVPSQQRPWNSLEMSWDSWCFARCKRAIYDQTCERHSEMASELGLWVSLLMCPRRIEPRQFWMISALRNTCSQNPKWTSILCWTLARFSSIQ